MFEIIVSVSISLFLNAALLKNYELHMQKRFIDVYEKIRMIYNKSR